MKNKIILFSTIACLLCGCSGTSSSSTLSPTSSQTTIPISDETFDNVLVDYAQLLDPAVIKADDGKYYAYLTGGTRSWRGQGTPSFLSYTPIFSSTDMVNWTFAGEVASVEEARSWKWAAQNDFWSPEIVKIGDNYVFYTSQSIFGGGKSSGVGCATSKSPLGPFTHVEEPVIISEDMGNVDAIDPCVVQENGHVYMFFGNYGGIQVIELNSAGTAVKEGATPKLVAGELCNPQNFSDYTAPYVIKIKDKWCLFLSTGVWAGEIDPSKPDEIYHTVVFQSDTLLGDYKDSKGRSALTRGAGDLVMTSNSDFMGPGNVCVVQDSVGAYYIYFHTFIGKSFEERFFGLERLDIDTYSYPTVKDQGVHKKVAKPIVK